MNGTAVDWALFCPTKKGKTAQLAVEWPCFYKNHSRKQAKMQILQKNRLAESAVMQKSEKPEPEKFGGIS